MGCCRCWAGRNCCSFHASMGSDLSKKRHASFYHILAIVIDFLKIEKVELRPFEKRTLNGP